MYQVTIEIHAKPSIYWGKMAFTDSRGVLHEREISGGRKATANSNALQGAIEAIKNIKGSCMLDIQTDNDYLAGAVKNGWLSLWQESGWKTAKGTMVKNQEQWKELSGLMARHSVRFTKIKEE